MDKHHINRGSCIIELKNQQVHYQAVWLL